jgi:siroheme decarboxylase
MRDAIDQRLLNRLQAPLPLVARPFAALGAELGLSEHDVLDRVARLKRPAEEGKRGVIRQISAIFDSKALGYHSTLVAARVEDGRLDAAAAVINGHPGVSHNYRRNHAFNLWYTLAVPPDSALGLEKTVAILHRESGARSTRMLPTLRLFKIGVRFDMTGEAADAEGPPVVEERELKTERSGPPEIQGGAPATALSRADKQMIRVLQQDLPIVAEPFAVWAAQAGVGIEALFAAARGFQERGVMRRFAVVLRHREAGISANAMGVWAVPAEQTESFGTAAAAFPAVSHCYLPQSWPDWPYTMFTMVHAPTQAQCDAVLARIAQKTGVQQYAALYSTKEYKKSRVQYFTPDAALWERPYL